MDFIDNHFTTTLDLRGVNDRPLPREKRGRCLRDLYRRTQKVAMLERLSQPTLPDEVTLKIFCIVVNRAHPNDLSIADLATLHVVASCLVRQTDTNAAEILKPFALQAILEPATLELPLTSDRTNTARGIARLPFSHYDLPKSVRHLKISCTERIKSLGTMYAGLLPEPLAQ